MAEKMIKLPEGIGFTAEDFEPGMIFGCDSADHCADIANAKLPALFEEWVRREGRVFFLKEAGGIKGNFIEADGRKDATHQAYLMLPEEI